MLPVARFFKRKFFGVNTRNIIGTITSVRTKETVAALTFDDGPHPGCTPRLLDILQKHQAHATFFMVGKMAKRYPDIVQSVAQKRHAIGNHSWDHPSFPSNTATVGRSQIRACAEAVAPYGQKLFRPPFGHQSISSYLNALLLGYKVITWNHAAFDWLDHDSKWMAERIVKNIKPGSIVLFHDAIYSSQLASTQCDREPMLSAVTMILEQLSDRFRFITVPDLLQYGRPVYVNWYVRNDDDW